MCGIWWASSNQRRSARRKKAKKKRAPRQAPGVSSFALQEAQDIFGDVSALLDARKQHELDARRAERDFEEEEDGGRRKATKLLEKQFEPSLLESKFMTEKDDVMRDTDVPERLQVSCLGVAVFLIAVEFFFSGVGFSLQIHVDFFAGL